MKKTFVISALALLISGIAVQADVFKMGTGLTSLETVVVGDPDNKADDTGFGAVAYPFNIGKFEVTAAQYVEFLNAKAKSDPYTLFNENFYMEGKIGCQIDRDGTDGNYSYDVSAEYANRPVNWVSFWSACRFCNWLHNGQGDGDTETGAYTLNGYNGFAGREIKRNPDAKWFVPSEDEWYKAAYYDADKVGGAGYWDYPTRSDSKPSRDFVSSNAANYYDDSYLDPVHYLTQVGTFVNSKSGYGTFDQGGNICEWTEGLKPPLPLLRCFRGGSFGNDGGSNIPDALISPKSSRFSIDIVGFRIAGALPGVAAGVDSKPVYSTTVPLGQGQFFRRPWRNPVNGKPFFPMGWFDDTSFTTRPGQKLGTLEFALANLDILAREGANMVLFVSAWQDVDDDTMLKTSLRNMTAYLDHAQKLGIKVLPQIGGWYGAFMRNDTAEIARQRKWVAALCKHPALLGYQIYDEPEYHNGGMKQLELDENKAFVDAMVKLRSSIREWDSNRNHAVQTVFNVVPNEGQGVPDWRMFLPALDTFQIDRYSIDINTPYFGWRALIMAWAMAHGVAAITNTSHLNPAPCMQGVGNAKPHERWRDPLYDETRYMTYSSLTVGGWGVIHWVFNSTSDNIRKNVARLHAELRQLMPALEQSYEKPPFNVSHNHEGITREFIKDLVPDISTLTLEDDKNYYLIASDNSGVFEDVSFRMKLPAIKDTKTREAVSLNEAWTRDVSYDSATDEWIIATHKMCFGDVNIWVIPKVAP